MTFLRAHHAHHDPLAVFDLMVRVRDRDIQYPPHSLSLLLASPPRPDSQKSSRNQTSTTSQTRALNKANSAGKPGSCLD
jgi:hypothetical protein